jgi:hypothetical protein
MNRIHAIVVLMLTASISAAPTPAIAQMKDKSSTATAKKKPAAPKMTNAQKIALAMSAGPAEMTKNATIIGCGGASCANMNDMSTAPPKQLRAGTNGWACYAFVDEPMCLDNQWRKWMEAWMNKSEPKIDGTGIAYMLRGDKGGSNTDPYATKPTANNQWVVAPPHVMVLFQDLKMLDAYPTDPKNGGPWVMWKGTPYAHVMVPVSLTKAATMSSK